MAGLDLDLFWRSSIKTVMLVLDAKAAAFDRDYNIRAVMAWNVAYLSRTKRLPKVDTLFLRKRKPAQTWEQQHALMEQWYRAQERRKAALAAKGN